MRLTVHDAVEMLTWVLDPAKAWTIIDAGAHQGVISAEMLAGFPHATVYGFEPVPETFALLAKRAESAPRLRPVNAALGDRNGHAEINVNQNSWATSFLAPSERGLAYYGDGIERLRKHRVEVLRLDDWAAQNRIGPIHAMKIDVQGFETKVLTGAERTLRDSVVAVYSEAQLIPEYEGASTFSDLDAQLRAYGFGLHQIVDIHFKGALHEPSCCDALWIRQDALDRLRSRPNPAVCLRPGERILSIFERLAAQGAQHIAIYGAGLHTRTRMADLMVEPVAPIACIIDDDPRRQGARMWGLPIVSREQALRLGVDAVVLSSDSHEDALWANSRVFRERGIPVVRVYGVGEPLPASIRQTSTARSGGS